MKTNLFLLVLTMTAILFITACTPDAVGETSKIQKTDTTEQRESSSLERAMSYRVVSEGNLVNENPNRSAGLWFVTSEEAAGFEEYAQTAVQAVLDLYRLYGRDFTSVLLIPSDKLEYAGLSYAGANFAADGKGAAGMTGDAPAVPMYWKVRAADRELNEQELAHRKHHQ